MSSEQHTRQRSRAFPFSIPYPCTTLRPGITLAGHSGMDEDTASLIEFRALTTKLAMTGLPVSGLREWWCPTPAPAGASACSSPGRA